MLPDCWAVHSLALTAHCCCGCIAVPLQMQSAARAFALLAHNQQLIKSIYVAITTAQCFYLCVQLLPASLMPQRALLHTCCS